MLPTQPLAVKYDIEQGEYSLRRFFTEVVLKKRPLNSAEGDKEGLALEADFQSLLASELHHHSKGHYSVTVEPHTAESKRRDVLCSKGDMFVSIELKMSRRWTLEKYEEALEAQLVCQYMRHTKATAGFLVIVLQDEGRTWNDPKTERTLDFKALLAMLRDKALALESKDRRRYLRVIGIDATKPANFRLEATTTVKPTKAPAAPKPSKKTAAPAKRTAAAKKTTLKVAKARPVPATKSKAAPVVKSGAVAARKTPVAKKASASALLVRR